MDACRADGSSQTVLIVEDDGAEARLATEMLVGVVPESAFEWVSSAGQAVARLGDPGVGRVPLDLGLPDGTALDALNAVKWAAPAVPVVLSGLEAEGLALAAVARGASEFLAKATVDRRTLRDAVARALGASELVDEPAGSSTASLARLMRTAHPAAPQEGLTLADVATRAGVDEATARLVLRAIGFPDPAEDDRVFTADNAEALAVGNLVACSGVLDGAVVLQQLRVMSRAMATVAASHVDVLVAREARAQARLEDRDTPLGPFSSMALPVLDRLLAYLYRRHLAAAAERSLLAHASGGHGDDVVVAVGFAYVVGSAAMSNQLDERDLAYYVERFTAATTDIIAMRNGRLVKMLGDEVMFAADDAGPAIDVACDLVDALGDDPRGPRLLVGVAFGNVLSRHGDLFGPTVNLADRLVTAAHPATVVAAAEVKDALAYRGDVRFELMPARRVKDFGRRDVFFVPRTYSCAEGA